MTAAPSPEQPRRLGQGDLRTQFFWYLIVGGTAFLADMIVFLVLMNRVGLGALPASALGFVVGTAVNHLLCLRLAFVGGRYDRPQEVVRLFLVALVGLGLTTVLVWAFLAAGLPALAAKLLAVVLVLGWNFLGRRLFVFHRGMPPNVQRISSAAVDRVGDALRRRKGAKPSMPPG